MNPAKRILVLDDNVDVAQSMSDLLMLNGYEVSLAHDGASAIEKYSNDNVDIGLFDVKMPGMNGVDAFLAIRKRNPEASIILMSGYADQELLAKALDYGAAGTLNKPFEAEDMLAAISALADERLL